MDTAQQKDLWAIVMSIVERNISKLPFANEVYDSIRDRMKGILDNPEKLIEFLCQHLKPKELEKKQNGEVFTPPSLISEKFDKLTEAYPEVWSNPNLKFLDPANGIGNYPALAYGRLMVGLETVVPDPVERKKHILENMLYMCELNPKNIEVSRKLFDAKGEYKLNLFQGSFFDLDPVKEWGVEKFDIIMGNPPYNKDTSKNNAKGQIIWPQFVKKSFELLADNKYLMFIHPPNWRKPKHELRPIFLENNLVFIKFYTDRDSDKIFSCKTRVDYYILQKNKTKGLTTVVDDKGMTSNVMLDMSIPYIPNYGISIHTKLCKLDIPRLTCINPRSHDTTRKFVQKNKDSTHTYQLFNTSSSKGVTYYYSSTPHPAQNIKKVLFSNGRYIYPVYDDGIYGGTQSSLYIEVNSKEEGAQLINMINSNLFKFIVKSTKFGNFGTSHELLSTIPNLSNGTSISFTEDEHAIIEDI